jgi:predicted glycosyltransferase involved in capsule biosynthesis
MCTTHLRSFFAERPYHIYIIEQSADGRKFNRGKLLNIGFTLAEKAGHQIFVFHDVDLIPSEDLVSCYVNVPENPIHIARVWKRWAGPACAVWWPLHVKSFSYPRYSGNPKYIGGAIAFRSAEFRQINGFPNTFWGWGGEDDEMMRRLQEVKARPEVR